MTRTLHVALAAIVVACSSTTESTPAASLLVTPDSVVLLRGTQTQLSVSALDGQGHLVTGVAVTFRSADTSIASVTALGLVNAVGKGRTTITVSRGGASALVPMSVTVPVQGVRLTPASATIHAHGTVQFSAALDDIDGDPVSPQPTFQYSSSDMTIITMRPVIATSSRMRVDG